MPTTTFIRNEFATDEMGKCTAYVEVDGEEIAVDWILTNVHVHTKQELIDYLCNEAIKKYNQTR